MVSFEQLSQQNGKRPFGPFWVRLENGETLHVTQPNRAVVTRKQFVFTPDGRALRKIPLEQVTSHGPLQAPDDLQNGNGR